MKEITTFLLTTLLLATAVAQDEPPEEEQEDIRRYTVEIIIFSYVEEVSVGTELFPADAPPVEEELLVNYDEIDIADADNEDAESEAADPELVMLTEDEYTMSGILRKFELLDVYETTMHFGWTQSTHPQEETQAIELRRFGEPPQGLDGSFTLYLSRFLHLVVDLALDAPEDFSISAVVDEPYLVFGDSRNRFEDEIGLRPQPVRYRIHENRIVRNGDVRYFDHPKFGVVAKITRVEEEEIDADNAPGMEPLVSRPGQ
jgi:hypothetical protein